MPQGTAIHDTDAGMHIIQFKDAVKELAGGPNRSYLKELVGFEACTGESALIKGGYKPNLSAGRKTTLANLTNRYTYDQSGTTLAHWIDAMMSGNDTVESQRTQVVAQKIDVAKWFDSAEKEFLEMTDPSSRKLKNLMQGLWTKEDLLIIEALMSATETRVASNAATAVTTASVSMPATQVLADQTYGSIDTDIFTNVKEIFMTNYVAGQTIYLGMGPKTWGALTRNSRDVLKNQDYVDSAKYFMGGDLPTVDGVVPVVHPLFENATQLDSLLGDGEAGLLAAWTEEGITWAEFRGLKTLMDVDQADKKGQSVAYIDEFVDCCRNDDLLVVQGAILSA